MLTPHDGSDLAGPAHAMATCGAPQALSFAQHLSGANLALGICLRPARRGLRLLRLLRHLQLRHGLLRCLRQRAAVHRGRRARHDPRTPTPARARRIKMFFKHAALVFAYTTYISMAAMIVLKMGARGGYADQVGMTHPLARLFMIAIISVVAIGVFWWLKRELGDHTRQDFTHSVTRTRAAEAAKATNADKTPTTAPASRARGQDQEDSTDDPDQPLTGPPVNGRPPGGRPPSPGRTRPPTPGPQPPRRQLRHSCCRRSAARWGAAGAAAGEAATATVAPEAVAGAAVTSHVTQRLHRDHNSSSGQPTAPSRTASGSTVATDPPQPAPATGRTNTTTAQPHTTIHAATAQLPTTWGRAGP